MLAFDVQRADLRDALLDRAFRRGLVLLPAGERAVRFYPRYDTEPSAIDEALPILRVAIDDLVGGGVGAEATPAPKVRVGTLAIPLEPSKSSTSRLRCSRPTSSRSTNVEQERYGDGARYPADVLRAGGRPLLQFPLETLEATIANPRAIGIAARDRVSGRFVGYAARQRAREPRRGRRQLGSALRREQHVLSAGDGHAADGAERRRARELSAGCAARARDLPPGSSILSTLIEDRMLETGPAWLREAAILERIDNYLRSGFRFVYLQAALQPSAPSSTTS